MSSAKKATTESHYFFGQTLTEALNKALESMLVMVPDAVLNIESHFFNTTIEARTCELELDVGKQLWLNKQRWSRLIKEYVPLEPLERFIEQAQYIFNGEARKGATANMMFRDPPRYEKKHRWGGCMMGAVYRGAEKDDTLPQLTFFSRTSYIGYIGMLDAAIAQAMAQAIASLSQIGFRWHIGSAQLHHFKTLPWIFSDTKLYRHLNAAVRWLEGDDRWDRESWQWYYITKWYRKVLEAFEEHGDEMLEHEKYGPFKRIKRRWMEHEGHLDKNVPPSLMVSELGFEKAE